MIILAPACASNFTTPSQNHSFACAVTLPDELLRTSYNEEWASNLHVPWKKCPQAMMTVLKNKQRPQKMQLFIFFVTK